MNSRADTQHTRVPHDEGAVATATESTADTALVQAARAGNSAAHGELFERYHKRIYNYAYGIAGNAEDAADVAQEAFVRVFQALPRIEGDLNFSAYLYRTAHNIAVDTAKHSGRYVPSEELDLEPQQTLRADPERTTLLQEQQRHTWQAAFRLNEKHRSILTLRELHDMSYADIAEVMDMPRNTVGVLLSRARLKFKEEFRMSSVDAEKLAKECRRMLPLLSAYIDDELEDDERSRVRDHLEQCAFCRLALEEMTEASRSYRALIPLLPPAALGDGVWARLGDAGGGGDDPGADDPGGDGSKTDGQSGDRHSGDGRGGGNEPTVADHPLGSSTAGGPSKTLAARLLTGKMLAVVAGGAVVLVLAGGAIGGGVPGFLTGGADSGEEPGSGNEPVVAVRPETADESAETTTESARPVTTGPTSTTTTAPATTTTTERTTTTTAAQTAPAGGPSEPQTATTATTPGAGQEPRVPEPDSQAPPSPQPVSPANGATIQGSTATLRWRGVSDPSGVSYTVDIESYNPNTGGFQNRRTVSGLSGTSTAHTLRAQQERWRVTAVDGAGNVGSSSSWWNVYREVVVVPAEPLVPVEPATPLIPIEPRTPLVPVTTTEVPIIY